jgi:hypothetical protein
MAFVLLIVEKREDRLTRPKDVGHRMFDEMVRYRDRLQSRGILQACESLKPDTEGVRLEARGGRQSTVDGPFTEAKEFVGGFFLIDVPTKQEALAIARECPAVEWATVEVRETGPCHGDV